MTPIRYSLYTERVKETIAYLFSHKYGLRICDIEEIPHVANPMLFTKVENGQAVSTQVVNDADARIFNRMIEETKKAAS